MNIPNLKFRHSNESDRQVYHVMYPNIPKLSGHLDKYLTHRAHTGQEGVVEYTKEKIKIKKHCLSILGESIVSVSKSDPKKNLYLLCCVILITPKF